MPGDFLLDPLPYDPADRASCLRHARRLQEAGSLRKAILRCVPLEHQPNVLAKVGAILSTGGKGVFGNAIEAGHFYYLPNSSSAPDLEWAELKCTCRVMWTVPGSTSGRRVAGFRRRDFAGMEGQK